MTVTLAMPESFPGLFDESARRTTFLAARRRLSYGDLIDRVGRCRGLFRRLGLEAGDRAVLAAGDEESTSVLYAACLLSGVVAVVIDSEASASEATVLVARTRPKAAFLPQGMIDRTESLQREDGPAVIPVAAAGKRTSFGLIIRRKAPRGTNTFPDLLEREEKVESVPELPADSTALILFTSGTTSKPKGVELTLGNLAAQMQTFRSHFGLDAGCRIANHLPLHHSDGLNQGPLLAFATGATWLRPSRVTMQTLGDMLDSIYRERATHLITVPTVLAMMMRLPEAFDDSFSSPEFRFVESTAGYLEESLWRRFEDRFQTTVVNCYGLTETVNEALYCGPTRETRRLGTIGKPVDCEVRLETPEGAEARTGESGRLLLRGANVMRGYFEDPEATAASFEDGWLISGDLATCDEDGFYRIVGREKNVIIRAGMNVYPEDVSTALLASSDVTEAVTIGLPDPLLGERVISCVVASHPADPPTPDSLFEHCRRRLAPEKVPNEIVLVDRLPRGPAGKVELAKVRSMVERTRSDRGGDSDSVSAADRVMRIAAATFHQPAETLTERASEADIPGWDSLSFLEFVVALEHRFDLSLPPRDVMRIRTLGDACRVIESRLQEQTGSRSHRHE